MPVKTLANALHDELRDVLSSDKQLVEALPKMVKKVTCVKLTAALEEHLTDW